jgi:pyridoxal phosphate enzyme (YggS family)
MTVGIVLVSHSAALAEATRQLAMQMAGPNPPAVAIAAGTPDGGLGTDAAAVAEAITAVQLVFGENRVQEAMAKYPPLRAAHPELKLHIIGGLQTNKARDAVHISDTIETLDRPKLADALAHAMAHEGRRPEVLVQVNVGDEPQKFGVPRTAADAFIEACQERFGALLRGLMCIPPLGEDPRPHFTWLAACAARHRLAVLSMGMSGDFEVAIACGATHVRIGTAIFGERG